MLDNLKKHREIRINKIYQRINERYTRFVQARNGYRKPSFGSEELESKIILDNFGLQLKKAEQREKIPNRVCYQPLFLGVFKKKKWLNIKVIDFRKKQKCNVCKQVKMIDNIYIIEKICRDYALVTYYNEKKYKFIKYKPKKSKTVLNIVKFIK